MLARYLMFAGYNAWCNARLYAAAATVSDADYRADRGAFFKSLHGTLNHLLVGDRIWMQRFTGEGEPPPSLDAILYEDFAELRAARALEDARISGYIASLKEDDLDEAIPLSHLRAASRRSSSRWRRRSTISSITRPTTAARPTPCSRPSSATTRRPPST